MWSWNLDPQKKDKKDWHELNFLEEQGVHQIWQQKEWRNFGRAESRTSWQETKKIQIKFATTCNNEQQQDAKCKIEI